MFCWVCSIRLSCSPSQRLSVACCAVCPEAACPARGVSADGKPAGERRRVHRVMAGLLLSTAQTQAREHVSSLASSLWHVWGCGFSAPFPWGPRVPPGSAPQLSPSPSQGKQEAGSSCSPSTRSVCLGRDEAACSMSQRGLLAASRLRWASSAPASLQPCPAPQHTFPPPPAATALHLLQFPRCWLLHLPR